MASQPSGGRTITSLVALLLILAGVALCVTIVLIAVGQGGGGIAAAIFCLILLGAAGMDAGITKRKLATHGGDARAVEEDSQDAIPAVVQTAEEPVGVSGDVHTDLNPHDLPIDHPGRQPVEGKRA